jgi:hypothetical protein
MPVSIRKRSREALTLAALLVCSVQAAERVIGPDDYTARAKEFLGRLYPRLDDRLSVVITGPVLRGGVMAPDVMNRFRVELYGREPSAADGSAAGAPESVLSADFTFDWQTEKKELVHLQVWGPTIDSRRDKVLEELKIHSGRSEAQLAEALNKAGAKYGPDHKAEFLRAVPLERLGPYLGGELKIVSVDFLPRAGLSWAVQTRWHSPDGREADCTLSFEPFDGLLTMIFRNPE